MCSPTTGSASRRIALWAAAAMVLLASASAGDRALGPEERLGQRVYVEGVGAEGREIIAVLGQGGTEVPAAVLPCVGCHGEDGRGRAEGGLSPSDVTWPALTRPYLAARPGGRQHPPYDEARAKRAVTMGLDPAGNALHVAMPRYRLTHREAAALVAYLKRLGQALDPGIGEDSVRLGVVLPPAEPFAALAGAVRAVLEAAAARRNAGGGVYRRRLELVFLTPPLAADARREAVASWLAAGDLFALVAPFLAGADVELASLARERSIPMIGPLTGEPQQASPPNPFVFYLAAGLASQARALVDFVAASAPVAAAVTVVHARTAALEAVVEAIRAQGGRQEGGTLGDGSRQEGGTRGEEGGASARHGSASGQEGGTARQEGGTWMAMGVVGFEPSAFDATAAVQAARAAGTGTDTDVVFFLGGAGDTEAFLAAAAAAGWHPRTCLLAPLVGAGLSSAAPAFAGRIVLALSSQPALGPRGEARYRSLGHAGALPSAHRRSQLAVLAAFDLLVEGLERSGRELSRQRLIAALEGLYRYDTGLTPVLTFGPNRRIGALGAYIVTLDPERQRFGDGAVWVTPRS